MGLLRFEGLGRGTGLKAFAVLEEAGSGRSAAGQRARIHFTNQVCLIRFRVLGMGLSIP